MASTPTAPRRIRRAASRNGGGKNAITAAAEDLNVRLGMRGGSGGQIGEEWQKEIWDLYRKVPELRAACRITGRAMSQCRLVLARVNEKGEPAPLDFSLDENGQPNTPEDYNHPGRKLLAAFAGGQHGQTDILDAIGVALTAPGEIYLVGALDQENRDMSDEFTRMKAYSTSQVTKQSNKVVVKLDESRTADRPLADAAESAEDPTAVVAIRVWRPDPEFNYKADSAARSAIGVLREIVGYDDHIEATILSRLAGNGIMWVPDSIELPGIEAADEPDGDGSIDPFLLYLMEVMSLAMKERKSAAAMVPILARADKDDIAAIKHMTFSTPFDEKVTENREKAVGRLGVAVDMPGEILLGLGNLQSWTGSLVTEEWKSGHLSELMGFACSSITYGWFYKALVAAGHGDLESDVIIWYDDSSVRTRENTGPEVQAAYDRGEIDGDALRRVLGFDESDKPTDEEFVKQVAKILLLKNPSLAPLLMPLFGFVFTEEQLAEAGVLKNLLAPGPTEPEEVGPSSDGTYKPASMPTTGPNAAVPNPTSKPATAAEGSQPEPVTASAGMKAFQSVAPKG